MKTQLILFDSLQNSGVLGTLRGCFAIIPIIISIGLYAFYTQQSNWKKWLAVILISLALCSAIGVQLPANYKECITYGALIGLVVSVCFVCGMILFNIKVQKQHLLTIPILSLVLILSAFITRAASLRFRLYGSNAE